MFPELFAIECGIPLDVIKNTWYLYIAGTSRLPICPIKFDKLAEQTENMFHYAIPWHPINISWHRMGWHWSQMMYLLPPTITLGHITEV